MRSVTKVNSSDSKIQFSPDIKVFQDRPNTSEVSATVLNVGHCLDTTELKRTIKSLQLIMLNGWGEGTGEGLEQRLGPKPRHATHDWTKHWESVEVLSNFQNAIRLQK